MLRIAICDDEKYIFDHLKKLITKSFNSYGQEINISLFEDGNSLLADIAEKNRGFDIAFLDVDMPLLNGFATAERLKELNPACLLIFITNMEQYARKGYLYSAFRYIYKSNLQNEIPEAVLAILKKLKLSKEESRLLTFKYKTAEGFEHLETTARDILYLHMDKTRKVILKTHNWEYVLPSGPLIRYQEKADSLFLITRNYLINFNNVVDMQGNFFILTNGEKISLGYSLKTQKASRCKYLQYLYKRSEA